MKSDGTFRVIPLPEKEYVGSTFAVFKSNKEQIYGLIYRDKKTKLSYSKRFKINKFIMNKEYSLIPKGCKIEKLYDRYGVVVRCQLPPARGQRITHIDIEFDEVALRGTTAKGFKIHSKPIAKFLQIKRGSETPAGSDDPAPAVVKPLEDEEPEETFSYPQPIDDSYAILPSARAAILAAQEPDEPKRRRTTKKKKSTKSSDQASETTYRINTDDDFSLE